MTQDPLHCLRIYLQLHKRSRERVPKVMKAEPHLLSFLNESKSQKPEINILSARPPYDIAIWKEIRTNVRWKIDTLVQTVSIEISKDASLAEFRGKQPLPPQLIETVEQRANGWLQRLYKVCCDAFAPTAIRIFLSPERSVLFRTPDSFSNSLENGCRIITSIVCKPTATGQVYSKWITLCTHQFRGKLPIAAAQPLCTWVETLRRSLPRSRQFEVDGTRIVRLFCWPSRACSILRAPR
jgi:hypothetical protein